MTLDLRAFSSFEAFSGTETPKDNVVLKFDGNDFVFKGVLCVLSLKKNLLSI